MSRKKKKEAFPGYVDAEWLDNLPNDDTTTSDSDYNNDLPADTDSDGSHRQDSDVEAGNESNTDIEASDAAVHSQSYAGDVADADDVSSDATPEGLFDDGVNNDTNESIDEDVEDDTDANTESDLYRYDQRYIEKTIFPLFKYAFSNWFDHYTSQSRCDAKILESAVQTLCTRGGRWQSPWQLQHD